MLGGLASALRLLTVLPLPNLGGSGVLARATASGEHFSARAALPFFPLAGALVGAVAAGAYWLGLHGLSAVAGAALAIAADLLVTGNFHYDGLADTADGIWAHHSRARALTIMKDSRVGAHGVSAVVCALLVKLALLAQGDAWQVGIIVSAAAVARACAVYAAAAAPYARAEGTGQSTSDGARAWHVLVALAISAAVGWLAAQSVGLVGLGASLAAAAFITWRISRRLGGMTGDTYGATIVLTELVALAAMLAVRHLQWL
jgi:adenosylcobinamide-GDP ribazoletransferase